MDVTYGEDSSRIRSGHTASPTTCSSTIKA